LHVRSPDARTSLPVTHRRLDGHLAEATDAVQKKRAETQQACSRFAAARKRLEAEDPKTMCTATLTAAERARDEYDALADELHALESKRDSVWSMLPSTRPGRAHVQLNDRSQPGAWLASVLQRHALTKAPIVAGMLGLAAGMVLLSLVRPDGSFVVDVLPATLVAAAGMALAFIPSLGTAISSAKPEEGGLASGIVNTSYQVGSALGLAAMTAVATSQGAGRLGDVGALTDGYSAAFLGAAGIALVGALLAAVLLRVPRAIADDAPANTRDETPIAA